MDLAYLFLAEAANTGEGKFYAFGGGVHYLQSIGFPANVPLLAVIAGIRVPPEDINPDHRAELRGVSPDGEEFFRKTDIPVPTNPIQGRPDLPVFSILALNFRGLPLALPGTYVFVLSVDGVELGKVSFTCDIAPSEEQVPGLPSEQG
jgi:hypothetical protein